MVGEKLSQLLEVKKIKPGTLARQTEIPKSTIYSIIKRNNKNVDYSVMEKIADFLDVPVEYFYDSDDGNTDKKNEPITISDDGLEEDLDALNAIFVQLTTDNRSKLLELSRLYLNDQRNSSEN